MVVILVHTPTGLEEAVQILAHLPESGGLLAENLLTPCQNQITRQMLEDLVGHIEAYREDLATLSLSTQDARLLLDSVAESALAKSLDALRQWGLDRVTIREIRDV
jgi:hypothetical protein